MVGIIVSGSRFTRLVAVEPGPPYANGEGRWFCRCDCGDYKLVAERHLITGATMSCGCLRRKYPPICVGMRFKRLVVVSPGEPYPDGSKRWNCACDCGQMKLVMGSHLSRGKIVSCGCLARELHTTHGATSAVNGDDELRRMHRAWIQMRQRCQNPRSHKYADYGGRGISVCDRWSDFANFVADMGRPPPGKATIDRIDNLGNYEPGNCRWASRAMQQRNRRNTRWVLINGEKVSFRDACDRLGQDHFLAQSRISRGWSVERAVFTPRPSAKKPRRERQHGPGAPASHWHWCGPPRCESCQRCWSEHQKAKRGQG